MALAGSGEELVLRDQVLAPAADSDVLERRTLIIQVSESLLVIRDTGVMAEHAPGNSMIMHPQNSYSDGP